MVCWFTRSRDMRKLGLGIETPQQIHTAATNTRSFKYASFALRLFLRTVFCLASVFLGFRMSQQTSLAVFQFTTIHRYSKQFQHIAAQQGPRDHHKLADLMILNESTSRLPHPDERLPAAPVAGNSSKQIITSGTKVGRHRILIREYPHPDPTDTMKAFHLIAKVQQRQEVLHGVQDWKPIIAITPTFSRMFQALHLTGLMHTLSLVRGPVTWIVIEAGGVSNSTAQLLAQARVHNVVHLGYPTRMPVAFEARWILESHLQVEGLRFVREKQLEGVIVFADDSNVYNLKFFDEAQKVKWVGVIPMGVLGYAGFPADSKSTRKKKRRGSLLLGVVRKGQVAPKIDLQVQTCALDGWHAHRPLPLDWDSGKGTALLDNKLQWAGFVMNARAVWLDLDGGRPHWLRDWSVWTRLKEPEQGVYLDLRSIFKDESHVERLADEQVLHWWIRMEGRPDVYFPSSWDLEWQPKIVLPARSTPWLEEGNSTSTSSETKEISSRNKLLPARKGKPKPKTTRN